MLLSTADVFLVDLGLPDGDGIGLIPIAMGLFAIAEVVKSAGKSSVTVPEQKFALRDQLPTREDWERSINPMLRGSALGAFFGALPGTSGGMATFLPIAMDRRACASIGTAEDRLPWGAQTATS